ncbi:MAG: hypothetical protein D6695_01665 [Planctomycetota bacterium]|nr:MAG: hypothetical protein D6695_01665 [Planctomycetota bacterium]
MRTDVCTFRTPVARGVTMLETVLAAVLVAMIATTLVSGLAFMHADHQRQQSKLGAAEVANRIMLQYLDDKNALPSDALAIAYGAHGELRYYWKLDKDRVDMQMIRPRAQSDATRTSGISADRLELITVRVWRERTPNVNPALSGVPEDFRLARIFDPVALRNPDSIWKAFKTDQGLTDWLSRFQNLPGGE